MTQIKGKLHHLGDTVVVSDKFQKREFVIQTDENYPQYISIQLTNDKCGFLDHAKNGLEIIAHINIRGREWENPQGEKKWFNTLEAWKLEFPKTGIVPKPSAPTASGINVEVPAGQVKDESDGIPF